ncbi:pantoate--beta-alanine ligase [Cytophagaceae bacterium 50C-KIRBA]|uniref:Pantothenate synthetase n=1 Tax=Aquirufa beregesia TaxID=2516556 RepID=A0ABX0F3T0_9BACT|nr:pantoate--beta-alanine ligase [Aquirufa beregesia]NGZ44520.1 pantoate--beta-alanine ligase [Aquirufa beregesia]
MKIFETKQALQDFIDDHRLKNALIGFVPTMGALHEGHISLIEKSKQHGVVTVCSIFVNPTQFNDPKDFEKYPKTIQEDLQKLESAGCEAVFLPSVKEMYPEGMHQLPHYPLGRLEELWEGAHRPGHFQGVCVIVHRLLEAVRPDQLFMGSKDFQQVAVIRHLIRHYPFEPKIQLISCDTIREKSGLAMSSRNVRLSPEQKTQALAIYHGFDMIRKALQEQTNSSAEALKQQFAQQLLDAGFESVDYIALADPTSLEPITNLSQTFVVLVAAFIGGVRLIDNQLFSHELFKRV